MRDQREPRIGPASRRAGVVSLYHGHGPSERERALATVGWRILKTLCTVDPDGEPAVVSVADRVALREALQMPEGR